MELAFFLRLFRTAQVLHEAAAQTPSALQLRFILPPSSALDSAEFFHTYTRSRACCRDHRSPLSLTDLQTLPFMKATNNYSTTLIVNQRHRHREVHSRREDDGKTEALHPIAKRTLYR